MLFDCSPVQVLGSHVADHPFGVELIIGSSSHSSDWLSVATDSFCAGVVEEVLGAVIGLEGTYQPFAELFLSAVLWRGVVRDEDLDFLAFGVRGVERLPSPVLLSELAVGFPSASGTKAWGSGELELEITTGRRAIEAVKVCPDSIFTKPWLERFQQDVFGHDFCCSNRKNFAAGISVPSVVVLIRFVHHFLCERQLVLEKLGSRLPSLIVFSMVCTRSLTPATSDLMASNLRTWMASYDRNVALR